MRRETFEPQGGNRRQGKAADAYDLDADLGHGRRLRREPASGKSADGTPRLARGVRLEVAPMSNQASQLLASPAVRLWAVTALVLVVKMVAVGFVTSTLRIRRRVFATPEDYALQNMAPIGVADEEVERARRAHRNDLENILPFLVVGFIYALTGPSQTAAAIYFIGFLVARTLHTIFYMRAAQPHRTVAFGAGMVLMLAMLVTTLVRLL